MPAIDDLIGIADISETPDVAEAVTIQFLYDAITNLTALGAFAAVGDKIPLVDISETPDAAKTITIQFLLDSITSLAALGASPAVGDKFVISDISDTPDASKTVTLTELLTGGTNLTEATVVAGDEFIHIDATDGVAKKDTVQGILDLVPSAGGWTFISAATASTSASLAFTGIDSTYDMYRFDLINLHPVDDLQDLWMRTDANGGASYDAGGSDYAYSFVRMNGASVGGTSSTGAAQMLLTTDGAHVGNAADEALSGQVYLYAPADATFQTMFTWHLSVITGAATSEPGVAMGSGFRVSAAIVDAVQFLFDGGNEIQTGVIRMYGRNNS
tara:strand:- start:1888 stop:2877 length:990 start_codon:yes stop_codon:yes gene_type:complete